MRIKDIVKLVEGKVIAGSYDDKTDIEYCYSCDLMSDVLAYVENHVVLITGLVHPQVIRTAEMLDIKVVIIVRGKTPNEEVIKMAESRNIVLVSTKMAMFTASGILFNNGLKGEETTHDDFML